MMMVVPLSLLSLEETINFDRIIIKMTYSMYSIASLNEYEVINNIGPRIIRQVSDY